MQTKFHKIGLLLAALCCVPGYWVLAEEAGKESESIPESPAKAAERNGLEVGAWVVEVFGNALDVTACAARSGQGR